MRKLSDNDITEMAKKAFTPDYTNTRKSVRAELKISHHIPQQPNMIKHHSILDLHHRTEEQAWQDIMNLANSGIKQATIITGASGILRKKFPTWVQDSILTPYIISAVPINNGSFNVKFRRKKD